MEGFMGSKIFLFFVVLVVGVGGYYIYDHYQKQKMMANGDITWDSGQPTPEEKERFQKETAGETSDGSSEHKTRTGAQDAPAATGQGAVGPAATIATTTTYAPAAAPAPALATIRATAPPANPPTTDSLSPHPANAVRFSGSGPYQWYRQGNLTWRLNTVSGRSCIDYATMEEWRKPIVFSQGCGRSA
jgi:hypothetical protein